MTSDSSNNGVTENITENSHDAQIVITYKIDTFPYKNPLFSDIIICENNSS